MESAGTLVFGYLVLSVLSHCSQGSLRHDSSIQMKEVGESCLHDIGGE